MVVSASSTCSSLTADLVAAVSAAMVSAPLARDNIRTDRLDGVLCGTLAIGCCTQHVDFPTEPNQLSVSKHVYVCAAVLPADVQQQGGVQLQLLNPYIMSGSRALQPVWQAPG